MLPNTGLVISLNSDCIALVPLWPKSMAVSQILSQLVEVAILELTWVLQSSRRVVWSESSSSSLIPLGEKEPSFTLATIPSRLRRSILRAVFAHAHLDCRIYSIGLHRPVAGTIATAFVFFFAGRLRKKNKNEWAETHSRLYIIRGTITNTC